MTAVDQPGHQSTPAGWAWCDGQVLPLAQNTSLFSLHGTTYGGNPAHRSYEAVIKPGVMTGPRPPSRAG